MTETSQRSIAHDFNGEALLSELVLPAGAPRAAILIVPTVMGVTELELGFARDFAARGYAAFVADIFGKAFRGAARDVMFGEMARLGADRAALRDRMLSILGVMTGELGLGAERVAAIGFCFGGKCVLDLARAGAPVAGVASFHGLFDPTGLEARPISAKVAAYHGWDDPMVPPEAVVALAAELTAAGADWQIHAYGHTGHGFTNPNADAIGIDGVFYTRAAKERAFAAFDQLLGELFG